MAPGPSLFCAPASNIFRKMARDRSMSRPSTVAPGSRYGWIARPRSVPGLASPGESKSSTPATGLIMTRPRKAGRAQLVDGGAKKGTERNRRRETADLRQQGHRRDEAGRSDDGHGSHASSPPWT